MSNINFENEILEFWEENKIFEKISISKKEQPLFTIYDAPYGADCFPDINNILLWSFNDIIFRYKTMQNFKVKRKSIWNNYRASIEIRTKETLNLSNSIEIEKYGKDYFKEECQKLSVQSKKDWLNLMTKTGFWFNKNEIYTTYKNNYIEEVWQIVKQMVEKDLLYYDSKTTPFCNHCQISLNNHEIVALENTQKQEPIILKIPILKTNGLKPPFSILNTYLLVSINDPWSLSGNTGLAISPSSSYLKLKLKNKKKINEYFILAKNRIKIIDKEYEVIKEFKGTKLKGLIYQPLFNNFLKIKNLKNKENGWKIYSANFIKPNEGTGIIHITPNFGEKETKLAKKNNLPIIIDINQLKQKIENNNLKEESFNELNQKIIQKLKIKNIIYKQKPYKQTLACCWICNKELSYQIEDNWFLKTKNIKQILFKNSQKINWVPIHIKKNIDKWIDTLEDWKISRKSHWGIPLPIWHCQKCNFLKIIDSKQEIVEQQTEKKTHNRYFILRSSEAFFQEKFRNFICSEWPEAILCPLTDKGREKIQLLAKKMKEEKIKIDLIFSSDFLRTKETAEIIAKELNIKVNFSSQLREVNYEVKDQSLIEAKNNKNFYNLNLFSKQSKNYENWNDCFKRTMDLLEKFEERYENKTILIISHGDPLLILEARLKNFTDQEILNIIKNKEKTNFEYIKPGELREIKFKHLPINLKGEVDLNSPYIDKIKIPCSKCNGLMKRIDEKIDSWFETGSFPFLQKNLSSINKSSTKKTTEKNFVLINLIFSGLKETQNWHYNLLLINSLFNVKNLYKTIIHLNPIENIDSLSISKVLKQASPDAIRLHLYSCDLSKKTKIELQDFKETDISLSHLWDVFLLFLFHIDKHFTVKEKFIVKNQLDFWIISKINNLNYKLIKALEEYDIKESGILIKSFINDFSNIYIKYSHLRLCSPKTKEEQSQVSQVIYYVLFNFAKITAPFIPFITERLYQELKKYNIEVQKESIHMNHYPHINQTLIDNKIEEKMIKIKEIIDLCLSEKKKKNLKVTQPLLALNIVNQDLLIDETLTTILRKELNVKKVSLGKSLELNYEISPELKEEGMFQEIISETKKIAKITDLTIKNKRNIYYQTNSLKIKALVKKWNNHYEKEENNLINFINKIEFISKKPKNLEEKKEIVFDFSFEKEKNSLKPEQTPKKSKKSKDLKQEKITIWIGIQKIDQ